MTDRIFNALEATWPAADYARAGAFRVGRGMGAGQRVSAAWRVADGGAGDGGAGDVHADDVDAAMAVQAGWDQPALFALRDGDGATAALLTARGMTRHRDTVVMAGPVAAMTDVAIPPVTAFAVWPPMAIQRDLWTEGGIDAARQDVMARVAGAKTALLGRTDDRAAGVGFVAAHQGVGVVHALHVLAPWQRQGLARWLMRRAAGWAAEQGCDTLALAVTRENAPAIALYQGLGMAEVGGYAYFA